MDYKIKQGDTLGTISKKYGVSIADLQKVNKIADVNVIKAGNTLIIPGENVKTAAVTKTSVKTTPNSRPELSSKTTTSASDNTNVRNPVTGMQFVVPTPEKTVISKSVPYESKNTSGFPAVKTTTVKGKGKEVKPTAKVVDKNAPPMSMIYGQSTVQDNTNVTPTVAGREWISAQQQLDKYGITDEQRKKGFSFLPPELQKRMAENMYPRGYWDFADRVKGALIDNVKDPQKVVMDQMGNTGIGGNEHERRRYDANQLYNNLPQKYNTFRISSSRPSKGGNDNEEYYSIGNKELWKQVLNSPVTKVNSNYTPPSNLSKIVKSITTLATDFNSGKVKSINDATNSAMTGWLTSEEDDKNHPVDESSIMGHYTIGRGQDENGNWYKSYYDKWDLAPANYGKPMNIYGRVYEETGTETPPDRNRPKLAKKIDAANDKAFANKTYTPRPVIKKASQGFKFNTQTENNMKYQIPKHQSGNRAERLTNRANRLVERAKKLNTPAESTVTPATSTYQSPIQMPKSFGYDYQTLNIAKSSLENRFGSPISNWQNWKTKPVAAAPKATVVAETKKTLSSTDNLKDTYKSFNAAFGAAKAAGLKTFMWGKMPIAVKMAGDKGTTVAEVANVNPIWGPEGVAAPVNPWAAAIPAEKAKVAGVVAQRGVINPTHSSYNPNTGETIATRVTPAAQGTPNVNPIWPAEGQVSTWPQAPRVVNVPPAQVINPQSSVYNPITGQTMPSKYKAPARTVASATPNPWASTMPR